MTGSRFRPGHPCPEPGCDGHLASYLGYEACCLHCFWLPEDGLQLTGHETFAWLRRCATESVAPWTPAARRLEAA